VRERGGRKKKKSRLYVNGMSHRTPKSDNGKFSIQDIYSSGSFAFAW
jgi:hypothetical protein